MDDSEALAMVATIGSYQGPVARTEMRSLHCSHCDEVHALAVAYYPDRARATERQVCYCPRLATVVQGDVVPSI